VVLRDFVHGNQLLVHYIDRLQRIVRKQSAPILHAWWHLGQAAICVAGKLESASATIFTGVPHLQRHNTTILAMWGLLH
jgi:hypothetical protein